MKNNNSSYVINKGKKVSGIFRPIILICLIVVLFMLARFFGLGEKIGALRDWIESLGSLGMIVFIVLYVVATVLAMPGSAITVAAGTLFGSVLGVILVSIASTSGASLAFLIARYFARESFVSWLSKKKTFRRLDKLTTEHGAAIVALTRLVPIFPFNILNYGFGLTGVRFGEYVFWSWLCMLPGTILYVVGADAVTKGLSEGKIPIGLLITVLFFIVFLGFLVRYARKKLRAKEINNTQD